MKIYNFYLITLSFILFPMLMIAQSGTTSAGHSASNANYQIGYSVGESVISSYSGDESMVRNGIIQPAQSIIISNLDVNEDNVSIFPNPTTAILNIKSDHQNFTNFEVISLDNRLILSGSIDKAGIDIRFISNGLYILRIKSSENTYSTLITKINI